MNFKVLALGALLGFAVAVVPSCGASKCSVANCKGCCSADGKCVADPANSDNSACGTQGNTCVDCAKTNQVCNKTTYQCGVTGCDPRVRYRVCTCDALSPNAPGHHPHDRECFARSPISHWRPRSDIPVGGVRGLLATPTSCRLPRWFDTGSRQRMSHPIACSCATRVRH